MVDHKGIEERRLCRQLDDHYSRRYPYLHNELVQPLVPC